MVPPVGVGVGVDVEVSVGVGVGVGEGVGVGVNVSVAVGAGVDVEVDVGVGEGVGVGVGVTAGVDFAAYNCTATCSFPFMMYSGSHVFSTSISVYPCTSMVWVFTLSKALGAEPADPPGVVCH